MPFTLQLLAASDLEGGVDAIDNAPNFAALADEFQGRASNTITVSAGDNYISGPFFNASLFAKSQVFNDAHNALYNLPRDVDGDGQPESYQALEGGRGRIDISIMNTIGFDASALGNHEFDLGTDQIREIIKPGTEANNKLSDDTWVGTQFPYLSANLDFSGDENLKDLATTNVLGSNTFTAGPPESTTSGTSPRLAPATILERGGEQIGVVGLTTPRLDSISSPGQTSVEGPTTNDIQALANEVQPVIDNLESQGVNKIVLTSHLQQIQLEQQLIGELSGVDIVIAGGSGTLLADQTDTTRPGKTPADTFPIMTRNADGDPAAIVSTPGEYKNLGRLVVDFTDKGVLKPGTIDAQESGSYATTDQVVANVTGSTDFAKGSKAARVADLTGAVQTVVQSQDGNTFGRTNVFLDGRRGSVRTEETNLGNITAEANLETAQKVDSSVQVSIKNGGGIRAPIGQVAGSATDPTLLPPQANPAAGKQDGEVSQLDITNSLRFNNELTLLTLTPDQLLQTVEHAVAGSAPGQTPGQFPQIAGMRFSFDQTDSPNSRVEDIDLLDDNGNPTRTIVENGQVVSGAPDSIRVVTLGFLADGGDDFPFPQFVQADSQFANRVNLSRADLKAGDATFSDAGFEQDALAEFLADRSQPIDQAETAPAEDDRIIQLDDRREAQDSGDTNLLVLNGESQRFGLISDAEVRGTSAAETLNVAEAGVTMSFSGNTGDTVIVPGTLDSFSAMASGNTLTLQDAGTLVEIALNADTIIQFEGATVTAGVERQGGQLGVVVDGETVDADFDLSALGTGSALTEGGDAG